MTQISSLLSIYLRQAIGPILHKMRTLTMFLSYWLLQFCMQHKISFTRLVSLHGNVPKSIACMLQIAIDGNNSVTELSY